MYIVNYIKKGSKYKFQIAIVKKDNFGLYHDTFLKFWYESNLKGKLNKLRIFIGYATCESFSFITDIKKALNVTTETIIFNELF